MACHLHPIICTWDAVTTCTPVTVFFPLGCGYNLNKIIIIIIHIIENLEKVTCSFPIVQFLITCVCKNWTMKE